MAGITNYAATQFLRASLIGSNYSFPTSWYLGLFTVTPTTSTSGTEVADTGGYARQAIVFNAPAGTPLGCLGPESAITFTATAAWGTVVAWGILDASASGNIWFFGATTTPRVMNSGNVISYPVNSLDIQTG